MPSGFAGSASLRVASSLALALLGACTDGEGGAQGVPLEHCGEITADETWTSDNTHTVTCDVYVEGAVLTIGPGVQVDFVDNRGLFVSRYDTSASLLVQGTESAPVVFTAQDPEDTEDAVDAQDEELYWAGLGVYPLVDEVTLSNLVLRGGGGRAEESGLYIEGAEVYLENVTIEGSEAHGLYMTEGGRLAEGSAGLTVVDNARWGVVVWADQAHTLPSANSSYTDNGETGVAVFKETIYDSVVWEDLGVPYIVREDFYVKGSTLGTAVLTVGPGTEVLFYENAGLEIADDGFAAGFIVGEPGGEPVIFGPLDGDEHGHWDGIYAGLGVETVDLYETTIAWGGLEFGAALEVHGEVDVLLQGVDISGGMTYGLTLVEGARFHPDSVDVQITNNLDWPIKIEAEQAHTVPVEDYAGNLEGRDGILVIGGYLTEPRTWPKQSVPWVIDGNLYLDGYASLDGLGVEPAVLTVGAGATMKFDQSSGIVLSKLSGASGLIAEGTADEPIQMLALLAEDDGSWNGIQAYHGAGEIVLRHAALDSGGGGEGQSLIYAEDSEVLVDAVTLSNSRGAGFSLENRARFSPDSGALHLSGNRDGQGRITVKYVDTLPSQMSFEGGLYNDEPFDVIYIKGDTELNTAATWPALADDAVYVVEDSVQIEGIHPEDPAILTIEPGAEFWMEDNTAFYVSRYGGAAGLVADAEGGEPIVFTAAEAPNPGRWQGIKILAHCVDEQNILRNVTIRYGGGEGDLISDGNLVLYGCDATVSGLTSEYSGHDGIYIVGDPSIEGATLHANEDCGIEVDGGAPLISGVDYSDNGYDGICD